MRFVQFLTQTGKVSLGVERTLGGDILDLCAGDNQIPTRMIDFLKQGTKNLEAAKRIIQLNKHIIPREKVKFLPPISQPDKVLCIGLNYKDHCKELGRQLPKVPVVFNKFPSTLIGAQDNLIHPDVTQKLDWEVEMAIIIGKEAKNVDVSNAMDYVFGYTVALDVTARDLVTPDFNGGQWLLGKALDTFCPLGPAIVTTDELNNPHNLNIICRVNGVTKQSGNTKELVHTTESVVAYISSYVTLLPGDVILTGTPPGVGVARKPPEFLKKDDVVECEIEGIGKLINRVV